LPSMTSGQCGSMCARAAEMSSAFNGRTSAPLPGRRAGRSWSATA
jgi:hypothetical protein